MRLQNMNPLKHIKVTEMLIQIYISRRKQIHIASYHSVSKALYTATLYTEPVHVRLPTVYMMNNDKNTDV